MEVAYVTYSVANGYVRNSTLSPESTCHRIRCGMLSRSVLSLAVDTNKRCHWVFPFFLILLFGGVAATQESLCGVLEGFICTCGL